MRALNLSKKNHPNWSFYGLGISSQTFGQREASEFREESSARLLVTNAIAETVSEGGTIAVGGMNGDWCWLRMNFYPLDIMSGEERTPFKSWPKKADGLGMKHELHEAAVG